MASSDTSRSKCFTYIWKVENARFCWQKNKEFIKSPSFVVEDIDECKWTLLLFPRHGERENEVALWLKKAPHDCDIKVMIDYEIAFIALDGTVLKSFRGKHFGKKNNLATLISVGRDDILPTKNASLFQRDTLTARCKIWKCVGEISENVQCTARTRIKVEKRSFTWNLKHFNPTSVKSYRIKSLKENKSMIDIDLILKEDKNILFRITPIDKNMKYTQFHVSVVDDSGNKIEVLRRENWPGMIYETKTFNLVLLKKFLGENIYLADHVFTLRCRCAMSFGNTVDEIENITSNLTDLESDELENPSLITEGVSCMDQRERPHGSVKTAKNQFSVSKSVLNESFRSILDHDETFTSFKSIMFDTLQAMVNNGSLSDIKIRTSSQSFPAHKFILSARSPKFKAMFSSERQRETDDCVDIIGLDEDTVSRILRYIYSSEIDQLEWSSATKLYVGADDYEILSLKDKCSSYLKSNLSVANACEALLLADKHTDKNLKDFVQKFILQYNKCIINSDDWGSLMKTNLPLAAETMLLSFQK